MDNVIEQFGQRWQGGGGKFIYVNNAWALSRELEGIIAAYTDEQQSSRQELMPIAVSGYLPGWTEDDMKSLLPSAQVFFWRQGDDPRIFRERCAQAVIGMSSCLWASADAGSIAVSATEDTSLLPTLLPPVHIVLLRASQIVPTFQEAMAQMYQQAQTEKHWPSLLKIIAGPSMTGDIEGQLIMGVHGPQDVYAVVVDEEEP
ncbi:LutC/YkgG family protein [Sulfobacillus thermosulfidooxidans]|uniref:LutC/YkgG family protein n=1 Tax=Sulfobacillus thermosulfidooxidans TaxID=28034 RepID=UPI0006B4785B|nr:LUD domain-containing protein [Sulfobacillus thermosulfidooxidans]